MKVLNTEMHVVTFAITAFELVMLFFQVIYFLERTNDRGRLMYLVLLLLLILHNVCSGFFPDPNIPLPIVLQIIIAYLVGFTMSMYVVYYFYKVFGLSHLRFFATYGLIWFLFLPFVLLFVAPYLITGDLILSRKLAVVIPFFYGLGFVYNTTRALRKKFSNSGNMSAGRELYEHVIAAYISLLCWATLPVIVFFGDFQVLEHSVTNAGFLMMTVIYIRSSIRQSRMEYNKLLMSEANLKVKVRERTHKLEQLIETRSNTFVNLAHETKTPLTLINNYLYEFAQKYPHSPELQIIQSNVQKLTRDMINFFDVQALERGFTPYKHNKASDFSAILEDKLALFRHLAEKKNITINENIARDVFIKAHPAALERIINNLVENAIKYTGTDRPIYVSLSGVHNSVVFSVKDEGIGIPVHLQERVFDPYFKLGTTENRSEGMGMGLAIVKGIVDGMQGEVMLISEEGKGTEVVVNLNRYAARDDVPMEPYKPAAVSSIQGDAVSPVDSPVDPDKYSLLVVEDNRHMLAYLAEKLRQHYNVMTAHNGAEAIDKLQHVSRLDLIICDVMMDRMDGFEFCKSVSIHNSFHHIPFIFLTARATLHDKLNGFRLGAVGYIEKPFLTEQLILKIDAILKNLKKQRKAVVNQAYRTILLNHDASEPVTRDHDFFYRKYNLTGRERQIINLVVKGKTHKAIGENLHISVKTVARHVANIFAKLAVRNRVELINKLEGREIG